MDNPRRAILRRLFLTSTLVLGLPLLASGAALAADDGFFNVSYRDIGFDLTQIGGYGELVVNAQGFKGLSYGTCTLNFTRDAEGKIQDKASVVQGSSATCPEELDFTLTPGKNGLYSLSFQSGGPLAGQSFDMFPVLVPMRDDLRITAPKGFDILGLTIGLTRTEIEAALTEKGYAPVEGYERKDDYQGGFSKAKSLWGKGKYQHDETKPADMIAISWTALIEGEPGEERAEYIGRNWRIPPGDNLSVANLRKSLDDKHGKTTSGFEDRLYDRTGALAPAAFQPVCPEDVHLQTVNSGYYFIGEGGDLQLAPACGSQLKVMVLEDYEVKGRASALIVGLMKGDVAYESFWTTWSRGEAEALKARYDQQTEMSESKPEL